MRQRVEELEKEVNSYRQQARAQRQQDATSPGYDRATVDEDIIMVDGSAKESTAKSRAHDEQGHSGRSTTTIRVDTRTPQRSGRVAHPITNLDSQTGSHGKTKESGAGPTPAMTPGPSPPSHIQTFDVASIPQPQSSRPQLQKRSEIGDSVSHPQPRSRGPVVSPSHFSPRSSDEATENLRSPTDLGAAASYLNPDLLSQSAHPRPETSFAQPYFSPPISNLGAFPLASYMDFSMATVNDQEQFNPHSNDWPWSSAVSSDSNRLVASNQDEPRGKLYLKNFL